MKKLRELKVDLDFNFKLAMGVIEATFREECRRQISQYKEDYSICAGMGVFAVYDQYGEPMSFQDMPRRLQKLDRYWDEIVDDYGYYMTTETIEKGETDEQK